jgi:two-component system cell cycle sensor histidine kinase/response regulator CckA
MKDRYRKKVILSLRWTAIIVTSYLTLFGKVGVTDLHLGHLFIIGYILSNLLLTFLPRTWFSNPKLFYSLVIIDTGLVSFGMYLSEMVTTDFYLVFFLIIIFASLSRNFKLLMVIGGVTAFIYGILLYSWGLLTSENGISYTLRIPFIFIMTTFYGYIVQTFTKEAKLQLAISEDKYRGLFENANDGIIILRNPQLQIADVNREVERLTGYKKEELLKWSFFDLFGPLENEKAHGYFEEVMKEGEARTDSLTFLRKDGMPLEIDLSTKRIDLGDESFFQVIFRDLTEQRILEKKIRLSKRNLESIFDGIQDRLSIQTPDYQILRINKAVIEHHHTNYKELIGKRCYEAYYQRNSPCENCPVSVTIETKQPSSSILKASEGDTTLRISSYPIFDERGNLISVIEYVRDITEEQRLQEQLIQSEKLAGIGILASGAAHEINNPLTGIIGMAEIAMEDDPSAVKSYLKDILNCGERIREIVKDLSSYSKTVRKEEWTSLDIHEVLENSLKIVGMVTKAGLVEVVKKYQSVEKMEANSGEIQLVFNHLITNGLQAMGKKGGTLTISTQMLKDEVEVEISDSGMGIPQKYLKHIFDPFFTTKNPGEGMGLGLNTVYRIVTKYSGMIDVESKEGVGTTFTVKFPIRRDVYGQEGIDR